MDGFSRKNRSELLEISLKVFDNIDSKEGLLIKEMGNVTVAAQPAPATSNSSRAHHDKKRRPYKRTSVPIAKKRSLEK